MTALVLACALPVALRAHARAAPTQTPAAEAVELAAGQSSRIEVRPGAPVRVRLPPTGSLGELTIDFDGAEVTATLIDAGGKALTTARAPERGQGRLIVLAEARADLMLLLGVAADYARPAGAQVQWAPREPSPDPAALLTLQREVYGAIDAWRNGSRDELQLGADRLKACLSDLRASASPWLLFEGLLTLGQIDGVLGKPADAAAVLAEAAAIARSRGDANGEGLALLKEARVRAASGEPAPGLELATKALALRQRAGDLRGEAEAIVTLAGITNGKGAPDEALALTDRAAGAVQQAADQRLLGEYFNLRGVILQQMGRVADALDAYGRALALRRDVGDRLGEGQTLGNMGSALRDRGEIRRAVTTLREAVEIRRAAGDRSGVGTTLYNLGNALLDLAEYQLAIDCMTDALAIFRETKGVRGEAFTLQNLGAAATMLGDRPRARRYYAEALPLWERVGDRRGQAIVLNHLADEAIDRDAPAEAAELVGRALELARAASAKREEADALHHDGRILRRQAKHDDAIVRFRQSVERHEEIRNPIGAAGARLELGRALADAGRLDEARVEIRAALAVREATGHRRGQIAALGALAAVDRRAGALDAAEASARRALDLFEQLRAGVASARARTWMGASAQSLYELARDILVDRHLQDPKQGHDRAALAVYERGRARRLLEGIAEGPLPRAGDDRTADLAAREQTLSADIEAQTALLGRQFASGLPAQRLADTRAALERLVLALDDVKTQIRRRSPAYADLRHPRPLDAGALQRLLDADTALLAFAPGETRSVGWVVTPDTVRLVVLPPLAEIDAPARALLAALTARNRIPDGESRTARRDRLARADAEWSALAARLAATVLGPFGSVEARRLAIVADGPLAGVPFGALPAAVAGGRISFDRPCTTGDCPLVEKVEVVTLPSASVLAALRELRKAREPRSLRAAVIADPVFRATDPRVSAAGAGEATAAGALARRDATLEWLESLPRLPASRDEAHAIAELAGPGRAIVRLDFAAGRGALFDAELRAPDVLHLASHAIIDEAQPELSGIVLSLVDARGSRVRGFVPLIEVYDLPIAADLVVLSACRSAGGAEVPGEGLSSLTRGFMHAGALRVVASLWSVEDAATAAFMRSFYRALFAQGLPAAAALRTAQAELRASARWASPYYWAAFTLHGDWE